jgi:regulator of nucleoside diphosphate kinase
MSLPYDAWASTRDDVEVAQLWRVAAKRLQKSEIMTTMPRKELPPIIVSGIDFERLDRLANAAAGALPRTADFLAREIARATIAPSGFVLRGVVAMGSQVEFRDDTTAQSRTINLVYPEEADIADGKVSVLSPVGAALIGLSVGQSIEWETPNGGWRSLTVLSVGGAGPVANPRNP